MTVQESDIIGYWFASEPVLPNRDGRAIVIGETLTVDPPLEMCRRGLHGSEHPFDALQYAPGPLLYRCRFSGEVIHGTDKLCASERTVLAMVDLTPQLRLFARQQALSVIHLWDAPAVVRKFLETGEESLRNDVETSARATTVTAARAAHWAVQAAAAAASAAVDTDWVIGAAAGAVHWAARAVASDAGFAAEAAFGAAARAAFMRIVEDAFVGHGGS